MVVIELTAMLCTLGEKRGLAQRLTETDEPPANVVADGMLVALVASTALALTFWFFPQPLFPGGRFTIADRLMVLNFGQMLRIGTPKDVMVARDVQEIYLGIEA